MYRAHKSADMDSALSSVIMLLARYQRYAKAMDDLGTQMRPRAGDTASALA